MASPVGDPVKSARVGSNIDSFMANTTALRGCYFQDLTLARVDGNCDSEPEPTFKMLKNLFPFKYCDLYGHVSLMGNFFPLS